MNIRVYNSLSRKKEAFEPIAPPKVGMYICGPTVYMNSHIGHGVGPVIFDTIKRYLTFRGYDVTMIINITDIDDKLIDRARKEKTTVEALEEAGLRDSVKIVIGGAPVTVAFAEQIGADAYAPDAATAVDVARDLMG